MSTGVSTWVAIVDFSFTISSSFLRLIFHLLHEFGHLGIRMLKIVHQTLHQRVVVLRMEKSHAQATIANATSPALQGGPGEVRSSVAINASRRKAVRDDCWPARVVDTGLSVNMSSDEDLASAVVECRKVAEVLAGEDRLWSARVARWKFQRE